MKTQPNNSKLNWFIIVLLLLPLLGGLIGACSARDTAPATPIVDQTDKTIQDTETKVAETTPNTPTATPTKETVPNTPTATPTAALAKEMQIADIAAAIIEDDLGEVLLVGDRVSNEKVIIFEERHDSRAGQLETAIMLLRLYRDYGMRYIALEGALETDGPLDASWYHQLADSDTLADVAVQMLKEGEISNAEFMALVFADVTVQGIEIAEEYEVELEGNAGSAPTLYLFYIASPSLDSNDVNEFNRLYKANKVLEAIEFVISKNSWAQSRYERLTDSDAVVPIEDLIKVIEEIEVKADEVNAEIDDELKANLQSYKRFFEAASSRSNTMVDKTLALLDKSPEAPIGMIIGAAHTVKISELFDNQGIAHVVIRQKALITKEPGELSAEAYERKLQALSVDEGGGLGALLDGRKKPTTVIDKKWAQIDMKVRLFAVELARAVAAGGKPPFNTPPYDLQTRFSDDPDISINWDSIAIDESDVIFSFDVYLDDGEEPARIWGKVTQTTDDRIGDVAGIPLEQLLLNALEDVRNETSSETEEQISQDNETPTPTRISHDTVAVFSNDRNKVTS